MDVVSVRIARRTVSWAAVPDSKLEIRTPGQCRCIGVVAMGTSGQATGYVTLVLSEKIRTLLKLIPLPKKMSATRTKRKSSTCTATSSSSLTAMTPVYAAGG